MRTTWMLLALGLMSVVAPLGAAEVDDLYPQVSGLIARNDFDAMQPVHQRMLANLAARGGAATEIPAFCFSGPVPAKQLEAFDAAIRGRHTNFRQDTRWSFTATNGASSAQGSPITLTYSFIPDGTAMPNGIGEGAGVSSLISLFDANFASRAQWQGLFAQIFNRWGEVSGIRYVFEPNDDGAAFLDTPGVLGVRGDLRIGAKHIDGNAGANVLAYNYFPNSGDMVIDIDNIAFFADPSGGFLAFRNTLAHEHGHGMGLMHVCPANQTKLMEPFISTAYDGPQIDDIQSAERFYGDRFEQNDTAATATNITGSITEEVQFTLGDVSIDDNGDVDFYGFFAAAGRRLSVVVEPVGETYQEGAQTDSCTTGTFYNSLIVQDLSLDILAPDGSTVIATANVNGPGASESLQLIPLSQGAGAYFVRVRGGAADSIQLYRLQIILAAQAAPTQTPTPSPSPTPSPAPTPLGCPDSIVDGSFEAEVAGGGPWVGTSTQFGNPFCTAGTCGTGLTASPRTGGAWIWFGGYNGAGDEVGSAQQTAVIPAGRAFLEFYLWRGQSSGLPSDFVRLLVDGTELFITHATDTAFASGYTLVQINLAAFADNQNHVIRFESTTAGHSPATNFNIDDVALLLCPAETPSPTSTPTASPTPTATASPSPTPYLGRPFGDFDSSGCTDLTDFLFLLDNWQLSVDGEVVGLNDFLALLDFWQTGPSCP